MSLFLCISFSKLKSSNSQDCHYRWLWCYLDVVAVIPVVNFFYIIFNKEKPRLSKKNKVPSTFCRFWLITTRKSFFFSLSVASHRVVGQTAWINARDWIGCMRIWLLNKGWVPIFCRLHQSKIELSTPAESRASVARPSFYVNSVSLLQFSAASPFFIPFLPNRFPSWGYNDVTATIFYFFYGPDTGEIVWKKNNSVIITSKAFNA